MPRKERRHLTHFCSAVAPGSETGHGASDVFRVNYAEESAGVFAHGVENPVAQVKGSIC